jgi:DNA primase
MDISIEIANNLSIRERRNHVLGYCPVCGCADANFFIKDKLTWNCWHCLKSGRIISNNGHIDYKFEKISEPVFDIPSLRRIYSILVDEYQKNLNKIVLEYLDKRGITKETIDKFKLGFCLGGQKLKIYEDENAKNAGIIREGHVILSDRLVIPYIFNGEITDLRGRIVEPFTHYKENTPKYLSLEGSYAARGANYFFNHDIIDKSDTVIITEGEFKAIVAAQYGFPIVATPGISKWNDEWDELLKNKNVILAADNEFIEGRRSPCYIQAKFLQKHVPHLKVAKIPRNPTNKKSDIDSLILSEGTSIFGWAIEVAQPVEDFLKREGEKRYGRRSKNNNN